MKQPDGKDPLPQRSLWRLLAVMLLVIAPHLLRLPPWETVAVLAIGVWRIATTLHQWRMPHGAIKGALAIGAFVGVYASYGRIWGQHAGVALLVIMLALKLTELRARRDVVVTVFLSYFLLLTHFLFSQEIWTLLYLLVCVVAVTAVLVDTHHAEGALPARLVLATGGKLIAQSLPLMLLMFVLFPRIPGPLWTMPDDSGGARSGLSETMSPGDIARLAASDELAFRVSFEGAAPPPDQRYWRGPVLWAFDGRTWSAPSRSFNAPAAEAGTTEYRYEITLEAHHMPWLLALDRPDARDLPERSRISGFYELLYFEPLRDRLRYRLRSEPDAKLQVASLSARERALQLALPSGFNPRALALAQQWRQGAGNDQAVVDAALRLFREQAFYYTLEPPRLGRDSIDEFLFTTRRGFCEHYASSFTFLMRAAGIPARVVTGYLGAQKNLFGDYYSVRQSETHAWAEVWIAGQGWIRVDPTAAVSPNRIEQTLSRSGARNDGPREGLLGSLDWRSAYARAQNAWDWVDAQWNGLVLGYGTEQQQLLLDRIGLGDFGRMLLALTAAITIGLAILGGVLLWKARPAAMNDPTLKQWKLAEARLARRGLHRAPSEGPRDFAMRVAREQPELAQRIQQVVKLYLRLRYERDPDAALLGELRAAVKALT